MQNFILRFALIFVFFNIYSQNTTIKPIIEDGKGKIISNEEEKKIFFKKLQAKKDHENKQLYIVKSNQTAVEICTNSGFEQHENVSGSLKLKNFLYTIGDPPGPTQCQSISNTANSYIDIYDPSNTSVMATTVPANLIDPYLGNINAFDQFALKINYDNSSTYGSIVQGKRFKTNNENYFKFNFKAVLMTVYDTGHTDNQPFVKARIINSTGVVVSEFCLVGDEKNCIFTKIPGSDAAILYTANWQSGLLDISSIPNNEEFTVEFMASRCGFGGHFGYMYIDDICLLHSNENIQGSIELNPLNKVCSTLPINVCGSYSIPNSGGITATLGSITLNLYNSSGTSIYTTTSTSSLDTTNHQFCFTLNTSNFPDIVNANYNVGVTATYNVSGSSPCPGTIFNSASDPDANPGWDISFQNCSTTCNFNVTTTKLSLCDSNHDGSENFNLTDANTSIVASIIGLTFSYFNTYADAIANTSAISNSTSFTSTSKIVYVRVTQNTTCFRVIPITLEVKNPNVNISGILNVCSGSTVLTSTPGAIYLWSNGAKTQSATVTTTGTYSVTVTDSNGCINTASVTIEPSQTATTPNVNITQPSCFTATGSIQVTSVASQYSFDNGLTWSTNSTINNLSPGTYYVKIKTINNCISYSLEVKIYAALTSYPNFTYTNPAFCGAFGSITITTSASFYSFDDGLTWKTNPTATNLNIGTYKIRTKDAQGCISNFNTVLLSSVTLETPIFTIINPACGVNGSITISTISDFYTFDGGTTWGTSNVLKNLTSGSYSIAIKSSLSCTSEYSNAYINDLKDTYPNVSLIQPICGAGGSIAITTIADFYSFDNGLTWSINNIETNLTPGTYQIKVKNAAGCTSLLNYASLYIPYLDTPILQVIQPQCGINGSITINTLSDFYSFDGGITWVTNNFMSLPSGSYNIITKNNLGCISQSNYVSLYPPTLPSPTYTVIQPNCANTGSITITTAAAFYSIDAGTTWVTNPNFNNLTGGSYYIKIKNNIGCESNYSYINLNTNYLANPTYTSINPSCGNIGNITFTSTADFYSIDGGVIWSSNPTFSNLDSRYYYPMVKNIAGCISSSTYVYLSSTNLAVPNTTIVNPCNGSNGSITITTPASFYSIDNGVTWLTNPIFSNLSSGYYYIKIKDSAGCQSEYYYLYLYNYLQNPTFTVVQPICGTNGSVTITTPSSFYSIDGGTTWVTNPVFLNLVPGYYNVKIKNAVGCESYSQSASLLQPYLANPSFTITQQTCGVAGVITITTTATEYSKDNGNTWQTSPVFSNLVSGYYNIVIKNSLGCISNGISAQIETYYLSNPNITIVQPNCGNNGSITIATTASQYSFNAGNTWQTNPVLSNLTSGSYYVMIKNSLGCISSPYTLPVYIRNYHLPNPFFTSLQPSCGNGGNITILTTADFYSFDNGTTWVTNPILLNPTPGYYNIKIKNNLGCMSESQSTYINTFYLPSPTITITQPTCSTPSGTIQVNTPANQFSFDNGATWLSNSTLANLSSGPYYIKIKNSLGCESAYSYAYIYSPITIPNAPSVSSSQPSSCGTTDGSITITTIATEYSFNDGVSWTTNSTKINLAAGTYYIKTRNNSTTCASTATIVTLNSGTATAAPTFAVTNPGCNNLFGSITITTPASYYSFDNGVSFVTSNTKSNLLVGTYNIKIKNVAGCISSGSSATISTSANNLASPNFTVVQPNCSTATGSITITSNAAFYSFDNGATFTSSTIQKGLTAGNYLIKIKDISGCISTASLVTINTKPITPNAPTLQVTQLLNCTSSTGIISVTSIGVLFSFDNGITWSSTKTSLPLVPGSYQVVVKETTLGCESIATTAIINAPPNAPSTPIIIITQPTTCANPFGKIAITSAAFEYSFDNGITYSSNPNSGVIGVGSYLIKVKNSFNCESTSVAAVINSPSDYPLAPLFSIVQPDCNTSNGAITIVTIASEYSFDNGVTWSPNPTLTNLTPTTYYLKIKNALGCISTLSNAVVIPFTNFTSLPISIAQQTFCLEQNATLSSIIITGQNIKWYDSLTNGNLLVNSALVQNGTTYYASQTINGCESKRISVAINIQNTFPPAGNANQSFCSTQNATLNNVAITGTAIKWYSTATNGTGLPSSTSLQDGITYFASQTVYGCESTSRIAISISLLNTLNATNYSETICDEQNNGNENINLSSYNSSLIGSTGNAFGYYTSANAAENQITTNQITNSSNYNLTLGKHLIYVRIDSPNSCHQIVELQLTLVSKPIINIPNIVPICINGSVTIDAGAGADSYLWSNDAKTSSITILNPGDFSVIVTKKYGEVSCSNTKSFTVKKSDIATITSIETQDWTDNENVITVYVTGAGDFEYSIDGIQFQNSNQFLNVHSGEYTVNVRDKNGCGTATDEVYLLMFPKFFTPNSDGYNDTWSIKFSDFEDGLNIKIFDRYGKLLKILENNAAWDGTFNGRELIASDYWFTVTRANGKEYKGHFSLKR